MRHQCEKLLGFQMLFEETQHRLAQIPLFGLKVKTVRSAFDDDEFGGHSSFFRLCIQLDGLFERRGRVGGAVQDQHGGIIR